MTPVAQRAFNPRYQCHGKATYLTKADAKRAAGTSERFAGRMRAYRCPHCDRFHIGHPLPRDAAPAPGFETPPVPEPEGLPFEEVLRRAGLAAKLTNS